MNSDNNNNNNNLVVGLFSNWKRAWKETKAKDREKEKKSNISFEVNFNFSQNNFLTIFYIKIISQTTKITHMHSHANVQYIYIMLFHCIIVGDVDHRRVLKWKEMKWKGEKRREIYL